MCRSVGVWDGGDVCVLFFLGGGDIGVWVCRSEGVCGGMRWCG